MDGCECASRSRRTVVTGGSGFLGTNLTAALVGTGREVLVIGRGEPRRQEANSYFAKANILDANRIEAVIRDFAPAEIVHLAAATGFLTRESVEGYETNVEGTRNVLWAAAKCASVQRCVFASSYTVALPHVADRARKNGRIRFLYEESKLEAERMIQAERSLNCSWCIVRPCATWGPWFGAPYRDLFLAIARRRYFHPGRADAPKRLSYVGNSCFQIAQLLDASAERIHRRTFFLADYETTTLRRWATLVADRMGVPAPRSIAETLVRVGAKGGDILREIGFANPPLTSFRLANIRSDTSRIPIEELESITGPLPFSLESGIDLTIDWLRQSGLLK